MRPGNPPPYNPDDFARVAVTVDVVVFAIRNDALHVLLVERGQEPFLGAWALPGGFVQPDEDLDTAAARELEEETNVSVGGSYLEQLGSYGAPGRDPRMRVITVAYWAACAELEQPRGGGDAAYSDLVPLAKIERGGIRLAFDHERILQDAVERLRSKLEYTAVATKFCRPDSPSANSAGCTRPSGAPASIRAIFSARSGRTPRSSTFRWRGPRAVFGAGGPLHFGRRPMKSQWPVPCRPRSRDDAFRATMILSEAYPPAVAAGIFVAGCRVSRLPKKSRPPHRAPGPSSCFAVALSDRHHGASLPGC